MAHRRERSRPARARTFLLACGHSDIGHDGSDSEGEDVEDRIHGGYGSIVSIPDGITLHTYTHAGKRILFSQIGQVHEHLKRTGRLPEIVDYKSFEGQGYGPFYLKSIGSGEQIPNYTLHGGDEEHEFLAGTHVFRPGQHQRPESTRWKSYNRNNLKGIFRMARSVGATDVVHIGCRSYDQLDQGGYDQGGGISGCTVARHIVRAICPVAGLLI